MKRTAVFAFGVATLCAVLLPDRSAEAIPAFARKYRLSCSTCHVAVPKLKSYGEDFAANGFLLPDGNEPVRAYIDTGDETLMLQRELPVAVRFDGFLQLEDRSTAKSDLQTPYGIKLLSGGSISKHVSYYLYFYMGERGEVSGLEDAYVHFNNIGNSAFDLIVGQFQVSDPLFKRELRLTLEDYQIYRYRPGLSGANLTYDRGLMATYSFNFGLDVVAEVLNGNGIGPARDRLFDFDNNKNFAFRASKELGPVRLGGFGYLGTEKKSGALDNSVRVFGPDATIASQKWEVNLQYLHREDDNPSFVAADPARVKADGGFVELVFLPQGDRSRWMLIGMYNRINATGSAYDYESATFSASHLIARNLRLVGDMTYDFVLDRPRLTFGFVTAF